MPASRNPFYIRTAEQAETEEQFLNLFSLDVLSVLPEDGSWNRLLRIESAPGGGKSTLLRLFTPAVLTTIANGRSRTEFRELVKFLDQVDVIRADGVALLGILVNCKDDYSRVVDLPIDDLQQQNIFRALLHSRLALLSIRAALQLSMNSYPTDIDLVQFEPRPEETFGRPDARLVTGRELFERARKLEQTIVDALNSFEIDFGRLRAVSAIDDVFQLLTTHRLTVAGSGVHQHTLVMFDDAHLLDDGQKQMLEEELLRHDRNRFSSWMAMRLRALEPRLLISEAESRDRESFETVRLDRREPRRIESWLLDVGNRRAKRAQRDVPSFTACFAETLEVEFTQSDLMAVAQSERERAYSLSRPFDELFSTWLMATDEETEVLSPLDQAVRWAEVQIRIERRIRKLQIEFNLGPLSLTEVDNSVASLQEAATLSMCLRNYLPYYFGSVKVASLASINVEQFLSLAAALFDLLLNSGNLTRRQHRPLMPSAQHRLLLEQSRAYVENIRTSLPYGEDVHRLVTAVGQLCREETRRPNAPVLPGVTGISLQVQDKENLIERAQSGSPRHRRLLNAVASAVAHNVLSPRSTNRHRDDDRVVFYLNRLMCPTYELPLGYGGYKPQRLERLLDWVELGADSIPRQLTAGSM